MSKGKDTPEELVIVGTKPESAYKLGFEVASKVNDKVVLQARGKNIQKALNVTKWAHKFKAYVVEKTYLAHLEHNDGNGNHHTVDEIKIIMKRRFYETLCYVPIMLMLVGVNHWLSIVGGCGLVPFVLDMFYIG